LPFGIFDGWGGECPRFGPSLLTFFPIAITNRGSKGSHSSKSSHGSKVSQDSRGSKVSHDSRYSHHSHHSHHSKVSYHSSQHDHSHALASSNDNANNGAKYTVAINENLEVVEAIEIMAIEHTNYRLMLDEEDILADIDDVTVLDIGEAIDQWLSGRGAKVDVNGASTLWTAPRTEKMPRRTMATGSARATARSPAPTTSP